MGYKVNQIALGDTQIRPEVTIKIPIEGLLAYYPLVSNANDYKTALGVSGTIYNGTWAGTENYGKVDGKTGALFSRGSNRINTGLTKNTLPITIAGWFYHTTTNDWETVIGNPNGNNSNGFSIRMGGTTIYITNGTGSDRTITTSYSNNVWICVVMTIESGTTKVYIDGELVTTFSNGSSGGNTFYIGSYGTYTTYGFNGYIKDVAIYEKALSSDEVLQYYNATQNDYKTPPATKGASAVGATLASGEEHYVGNSQLYTYETSKFYGTLTVTVNLNSSHINDRCYVYATLYVDGSEYGKYCFRSNSGSETANRTITGITLNEGSTLQIYYQKEGSESVYDVYLSWSYTVTDGYYNSNYNPS